MSAKLAATPTTEVATPATHNSQNTSPSRRANLFADYHPEGRAGPRESGFVVAASPTIGEIHALRSPARTNSDVQGLVKRFETLDVRDREAESNERRKRHEAELRRAIVAREEAENDIMRLREEVRKLKKEGDEGRDRERKVGKRLEVVMEEYTNFKGAQASQVTIYEKEVRKARKEAFKSSAVVLKLQEELKSARNTLKVTQQNLDLEKRKVQQKDQESFDAQYRLVALQEEVDKLNTHVKVVEDEREALKLTLKEEEVARIAAEGMIALPADSIDDTDILMTSPRRRSPAKLPVPFSSENKENIGVVGKKAPSDDRLEEQLDLERRKRLHAEELAEFLELECQFRCCRCRSHRHESAFEISNDFALAMDRIRRDMKEVLADAHAPVESSVVGAKTTSEITYERQPARQSAELSVAHRPANEADDDDDVEMEQAPDITTVHAPIENTDADLSVHASFTKPEELKPQYDKHEERPASIERSLPTNHSAMHSEVEHAPESQPRHSVSKSSPQSVSPMTFASQQPRPNPPRPSIRTVTTTTTIPMQFTPVKPVMNTHNFAEDAENIPPTMDGVNELLPDPQPAFDREAALAAIAYRRGRAKSIANGHMTPLKQSLEGVGIKDRRDISAPILGQKPVPTNYAKTVTSVGRAAGRRLA